MLAEHFDEHFAEVGEIVLPQSIGLVVVAKPVNARRDQRAILAQPRHQAHRFHHLVHLVAIELRREQRPIPRKTSEKTLVERVDCRALALAQGKPGMRDELGVHVDRKPSFANRAGIRYAGAEPELKYSPSEAISKEWSGIGATSL